MTVLSSDAEMPASASRQLAPQEIRAVLNIPTGSGTIRRPQGKGPLSQEGGHSFSFAVGMASHHYRGQYRSTFGVGEPKWLNEVHPYHVWLLCKLCVRENALLPEAYPACPLT
jgi:hypothetical protein